MTAGRYHFRRIAADALHRVLYLFEIQSGTQRGLQELSLVLILSGNKRLHKVLHSGLVCGTQ